MFSGTYCKKAKEKKSHTSGKSGDSRTPDPRDKGSIREIATGEITVSITPDNHLEGPYLLKTREFPGLRPLGPRQGLCPCTPPGALRRAPGPHPYDAHGFFRPPLFCVQILDPPLYTAVPLARPSRLPPPPDEVCQVRHCIKHTIT